MSNISVNIDLEDLKLIGADAVALYVYLLLQVEEQKNHTIYTTAEINRKALGWGFDRHKKAKDMLVKEGFIVMQPGKGKDGRFTASYLEVKERSDVND